MYEGAPDPVQSGMEPARNSHNANVELLLLEDKGKASWDLCCWRMEVRNMDLGQRVPDRKLPTHGRTPACCQDGEMQGMQTR